MVSIGEPAYRAKQVMAWIYQKGAASFAEMSNLPQGLRDKFEETAKIGFLDEISRQVSADGTEKYLFGLSDAQTVETVIIPYEIGYSACISTQVGCKMGCQFCASGLPGFIRNLTAAEIMAQVIWVRCALGQRNGTLKSIVIMGSGEPLDNFTETVTFLEAVRDPQRLAMSLRHVTLSTSGLVPKMRELAALGMPLTLAISLHAPNNQLRDKLMPINKKFPLEKLMEACDDFATATGRRITYEYVMIDGLNDQPEHARELAQLLNGRLHHVNLIPLNAVAEMEFRPSPKIVVNRFADLLREKKVNVTVRRRLGADIAAACGQLRNNNPRDCE